MNLRLLCAFLLLGSVSSVCQQPFLDSHQWIALRDEANSEATPPFNVQDQSELYAYEIFNFVDGKRTVGEIRDAVSAEYGPLPIDLVSDYLNACSKAKLLNWK